MLHTAKLTTKGQITIPKAIRVKLSVKSGDRLAFTVDEQGALRAVPVYDADKPVYGFLSRLATQPPASAEDFDKAIARHMIEKFGPK